MKKFLPKLFILIILGFTSLNTNAQNQSYIFTIHLGAFMDAQMTDFTKIKELGFLYSKKLNNLDQIYMGDYPSEAAATPILKKVQAAGYLDAFITRNRIREIDPVNFIQLGTEPLNKDVDWQKYAIAGPLFVYQKKNYIGIITGPFGTEEILQQRLSNYREGNFPDAFVKTLNSSRLHRVGSFQTGSTLVPSAFSSEYITPPASEEGEVVVAEIPAKQSPIPDFMVKKRANTADVPPPPKPSENDIPTAYDNTSRITVPPTEASLSEKGEEVSIKTAQSPKKSKKAAPVAQAPAALSFKAPSIRANVKRTSALRLQEVMKQKGYYKSGLDGLYGPGTKKAFAEMMAKDRELQKYQLLIDHYAQEKKVSSKLEDIIIRMDEDLSLAVGKLKGYRTPIADAFQAYGIYQLAGPNKETDRLLKNAVQVNKNKKAAAISSYVNYDQILNAMQLIYSVSDGSIVVPCWLFQRHPDLASATFDMADGNDAGQYMIQNCGYVTEWESIQLLETILKDLAPASPGVDQAALNVAQSQRAKLLLQPKPLSTDAYTSIEQWNENLWSGLAVWESKDPFHSRITKPLRVSYYQSWALLEDHFMNNGLQAKEARGLALEVLRTIVDPYLARFVEGA